ncbi:sigma-54-dependent Fis family transcriptional regulator [Peribacillus sp. TH14]|uniref:sigma-54-dependent Fis family transcriptional regulator n=1 Tax=Peribacillus sp. TH14 TaxID=2798481 RepID=UPI001912D25D|nr:sigma-54-dependent Fis family transcriptional regulator [Peribacillus sp. TH14]MBK5502771.1 sigma-54-dependent Fis family transcriptional regulator [Peribacillus sp. TH14]
MKHKLTRELVGPIDYNPSINQLWKRFQELGQYTGDGVRDDIIDSWENSKKLGISPFQNRIQEIINENELKDRLEKNEELLTYATPKINKLSDILIESKTMLSIADNHGTVLYSSGERNVLKKAEKINIFNGGTWSEQSAGTNAVGLVLKKKQFSQVLFSEHYCEKHHDWFCVAFPILYPFTNELLGIMNIAGYEIQMNSQKIKYIVSEAKNISKSINHYFFKYALSNHLFLNTALEGVEDAVFIVNGGKSIVDKNDAARSHSILSNIQTLKNIPKLDSLIDFVLQNGQQILREEVSMDKNKQKFICSIYPVTFQTENLGAVIFFRKNTESPTLISQKPTITRSTHSNTTRYSFDDMIGSSKEFTDVVKKARKASLIDSTLFLSGETGTGKELFAQSIHQASNRSNKPFVAINCGAVPHGLLESELFGYEPGAFTGAKSKGSPGKFELAQGGTIFLDEIGDMPLNLQVHLLRLLEERVVTRLGGDKLIPLDVRVFAATHKNLKEAVQKGEFREDLLYRLHVIQLRIPALRERIGDVPALVHHFIKKMSGEFGKRDIVVQSDTMQYLTQYHWPGNIRELKNVVQQSLFNMEGNSLSPFDLPPELLEGPVVEDEKVRLIEAMIKEDGNVTNAAKILDISRATMYRKIKQYQLTAEDWNSKKVKSQI